ncbi:MAG: hypothetical protein KatS3mg129_1263 [Leptospiraceae bacterium]|nr:MAG: hypothetical protein KatS3mg129_1263 [Leptospiraceae bacterium]
MYHIYKSYNEKIYQATWGTEIPPEYLAALISLESYPPGNWDSERFEPKVYERLIKLKNEDIPFGNIPREKIIHISDYELIKLATSYGLTQIMGYHCLDLGCSIEDLKGSDHLLWSIAYIRKHYLKYIKKKEWETCFRIHNTGNPFGKTHNRDYVEKGIKRMEYYKKWLRYRGNLLANFYEKN